MNVHPDLSFITLVGQASVVVQAVLLLLLGFSLWSWWRIFLKTFQLKRTLRDTDAFEDQFWKGGDLNALYRSLPQLHARDCEGDGFEWLIADDRDNSVFAWMRTSPGSSAARSAR